MRPVTYSWVGVSAVAPLAFLACAWALGVLRAYRRAWRAVDLFLAALLVQELVSSALAFAFALLSLARPEARALCGAFVWGLSATRALQAATAASLLADRALAAHRRAAPRRQLRYHLAALAAMAALVGAAALLARSPAPGGAAFDQCRVLPHALHVRLALFVLTLHGLLLAAAAVSVGVVQAGLGRAQGRDLGAAASTSSSAASSAGLRSTASSAGLLAPPPPEDLRWGCSLAVVGTCLLVNHLPYVVSMEEEDHFWAWRGRDCWLASLPRP